MSTVEVPNQKGRRGLVLTSAAVAVTVGLVLFFLYQLSRGDFLREKVTSLPSSSPQAIGGRVLPKDLEILTVLPPDAIRAILTPEFVSVAEADRWMDPDEPVISVVVKGEARAYSIAHLSRHEIVNDTVGGKPIAVTW
ncbi:MAG: DUF3179 domain-containing protein [Chloroflexi bacterium]|nr:DUF3179 domain-containing protein [Chloroflexota bacterium]